MPSGTGSDSGSTNQPYRKLASDSPAGSAPALTGPVEGVAWFPINKGSATDRLAL